MGNAWTRRGAALLLALAVVVGMGAGGCGGGDGPGRPDGGGGGGSDAGGPPPDPNAPVLVVTERPQVRTAEASPGVAFRCDTQHPPCTLECRVGSAAFAACTSPYVFTGAAEGAYDFEVRATNARALQALARVSFIVDRSPPRLVSAEFSAYDALDVTFDEPVALTSLAEPSAVSLTPARPAGLTVLGAQAVPGSSTTVRLTLSAYHLPLRYGLTLKGVRDTLGHTAAELGAQPEGTRARVMFLSRTAVTGNIAAWTPPDGSRCPAAGGLARADCLCQWEAQQEGLLGDYRAILSAYAQDTSCRLRGLSGTWPTCDGAASIPTVGPWLRMNGQPVALPAPPNDTRPFLGVLPLRYAVDGSEDPAPYWVVLTRDIGLSCQNWTLASSSQQGASRALDTLRVVLGQTPTVAPAGDQAIASPCTALQRVACAQLGGNALPLGTRHLAPGKRVFATRAAHTGRIQHGSGAQGLAAADLLCRDAASAAGLAGPERFVAWMSDSADDAYCRAAGRRGKRASNCGEAVLPNVSGPYVATTGQVLATDLASLATRGSLLEPFVGDELGTATSDAVTTAVWTGTQHDGTVAAQTCLDWTSADAAQSGGQGVPAHADVWATFGSTLRCDLAKPHLCVER